MSEADNLLTACQEFKAVAENFKSDVGRFKERVIANPEAEIIRLQLIAADTSNSRLKRAFATKLFTALRAKSLAA